MVAKIIIIYRKSRQEMQTMVSALAQTCLTSNKLTTIVVTMDTIINRLIIKAVGVAFKN